MLGKQLVLVLAILSIICTAEGPSHRCHIQCVQSQVLTRWRCSAAALSARHLCHEVIVPRPTAQVRPGHAKVLVTPSGGSFFRRQQKREGSQSVARGRRATGFIVSCVAGAVCDGDTDDDPTSTEAVSWTATSLHRPPNLALDPLLLTHPLPRQLLPPWPRRPVRIMILARKPVLPFIPERILAIAPAAREVKPGRGGARRARRRAQLVRDRAVCERLQVERGIPEGPARGGVGEEVQRQDVWLQAGRDVVGVGALRGVDDWLYAICQYSKA